MSSVILNNGFKLKGSFGKEINSPLFIQFVEGMCIDNCTSPDSLRFGGNSSNVNTIIAKPHLYNESPPTPHTRLGEEYRYKPLLRGISEVPAKGDPVLLCTISGINYYLGPLNTQNDVNWNNDNNNRYQVNIDPERIKTSKTLTELSGESLNFEKVNYTRMHKLFNDELDHPEGGWEENERSPIETHGDVMFEGRHGNSIRIGSRYLNPYVFISNGRAQSNLTEGFGDGSLISITAKGTLTQHFGGYDDSINEVTYLGFQLSSDTVEENERTMGKLIQTVNNLDDVNELMYGYGNNIKENQVLIQSDRITLNTKTDDIYISSLKDIHIGSGRSMSISNNGDFIIDSARTFLGNPSPNLSSREMEPMVLGNQLFEILKELLTELKKANSVFNGVPIPLVDSTSAPLSAKLTPIEQKLTQIMSSYHYIEPNDR